MSRHRVSPSPFLSSTVTHTVTLTSTSYNTVQILFPHVMWSAQAPSICLAWNLKHIIVQWVGIGTHTHTHFLVSYYLFIILIQDIKTPSCNHLKHCPLNTKIDFCSVFFFFCIFQSSKCSSLCSYC